LDPNDRITRRIRRDYQGDSHHFQHCQRHHLVCRYDWLFSVQLIQEGKRDQAMFDISDDTDIEFNTMVSKLSSMVVKIAGTSGELQSASTQIAETTQLVVAASEIQVTGVKEVL